MVNEKEISERKLRIKNAVAQRIDEEMVLLNLDDERYYSLDRVGCAFWQAITEQGSFEKALAELTDQFDADEATIARDLKSFIGELLEAGLLEAKE
jgi:hypothetical protein